MPKSADSDSGSEQGFRSFSGYSGEPRWSLLDLGEIEEIYWHTLASDLKDDGFDPEEKKPTYEWLVDQGYRQFIYALREYHDLTVDEFWQGLDRVSEEPPGYDWGVESKETCESMQSWLDRRQQFSDISESTVQTHRYRLARYAETYRELHGTDALLSPLRPNSDDSEAAEVDRVWDTFDALYSELAPVTVYRILQTVQSWYEYLVERRRITTNPTENLTKQYGWEGETPDSGEPAILSKEHVRELYRTAATHDEQLLVIGLCAWGLRIGELAALHRSQLQEGDPPYIQFDERKNGPGSVSLLYGTEVLDDRLTRLNLDDEWNSYLFPSPRAESGHRDPSTLRRWFHDLADRAGIPESIDGDRRKPHMGRRFWYSAYSATVEDLLDHVSDIAEEQGSASANVVLDSYLSENRKRTLRQQFMREQLADVFESDGGKEDGPNNGSLGKGSR